MAMQINLAAYPDLNNLAQTHHVLQVGDYNRVITQIESADESPGEKAKALLSCLSQAHNLEGGFKDECISTLESRVYVLFQVSPTAVKEQTEIDRFARNPSLEKVVQKITYLSKKRFISDSEHGYLKGTKFSHHIDRILKSLSGSSVSVGLGLVTVGALAFAYSGISNLVSSSGSSESAASKGTAGLVIGLGSALAIAPLAEAYIKSGTDELS